MEFVYMEEQLMCSIYLRILFSESTNQSLRCCVKTNLPATGMKKLCSDLPFPRSFFPINIAALPQNTYFFFHKMQGLAYNPMLQLPYHEMTVPLPKAHP